MFKLVIWVTIFLISGCASQSNLSTNLQTELDTPLICNNEEECKIFWDRATYFVTSNAGFKIQIHNDSIIETYNPTNYSVRLAFRITREPLGDDQYRIITNAWCANLFGCQPDRLETMAKAKLYIRTGQK